jgi:hypothetical protein
MKTITKTYNVYKFDELTEEAKQKAIEKLRDINVDYEWWEYDYEDANIAGLQITSFNLDRNRHAKGEFIENACKCAQAIIENHGKDCETYQTTKRFLWERDKVINEAEKDEHGDFKDESAVDSTLDYVESEYLKSILEDYSMILQKEYEYRLSDEAVIETIKSNDYDFLENGSLH